MFGLSTFGELIFADMGLNAIVEDGWLEVLKDPCDEQGWMKRSSNCDEFTKFEKQPSNWTVIK